MNADARRLLNLIPPVQALAAHGGAPTLALGRLLAWDGSLYAYRLGACYWQARCLCGWASPWRRLYYDALDDRAAHLGVWRPAVPAETCWPD